MKVLIPVRYRPIKAISLIYMNLNNCEFDYYENVSSIKVIHDIPLTYEMIADIEKQTELSLSIVESYPHCLRRRNYYGDVIAERYTDKTVTLIQILEYVSEEQYTKYKQSKKNYSWLWYVVGAIILLIPFLTYYLK